MWSSRARGGSWMSRSWRGGGSSSWRRWGSPSIGCSTSRQPAGDTRKRRAGAAGPALPGSQLYEYKVFGVLATTAELCADVYMDLAYRKHWDKYVKELYEKDFSGQTAIYWEVKYPFPLSNRDYVYVRERRDLDVDGRKISVIMARSAPEVPCAELSGVLRVKDYKQSVALESDGGSGTKVFLNYFDNPGGSIPTWLVNWAAKTGVPGFLTEMQKACSKYSDYCEKK
uniref:Phosphatidylcholine transfer protein n=1 Tax=Gasterosteus aculeatus aculeatus TaxID=481459 RepID=G3PN38_GASAC